MKKKIDLFWYWFIFVVAFVLCFFAINDKKVNAYHLNEEGNLVSDNISISGNFTAVVNNSYFFQRKVFDNVSAGDTFFVNAMCDTLSGYSCDNLTFSVGTGISYYDYDLVFRAEFGVGVVVTIPENKGGSDLFIRAPRNNTVFTGSYYIYNIMVAKSEIAIPYEPLGIWYSEDNLNKAKEESYQEGYNKGYVENNSIPTIYLDKAYTYYYAISPIDGSQFVMSLDTMSYITNLNATLNFSKFINIDWGKYVSSPQYMYMNIELLTELSVNDTIKINFNDISNATNFNENFYISFGDVLNCSSNYSTCATGVYLTYQDLLNNNFEIVLKEFNPNLTITSIDYIGMSYRYQDGSMYGVTEIIDSTLVSNSDTSYDIGYKVGYINGSNAGLVEGETIGYDKGYNEGYRKASQVVKDPGNNTLVGMVSVLMGMPVNMLISIYDFEFLGINLAEFFLSLITLLVSIWLIKKLL